MGDIYNCRKTIVNEIDSYLTYMEISSTDCWDKGYKDSYIASLYLSLGVLDLDNYDKYIIISAAWGDKKAVKYAKEGSLSYTKKPSRYEY